jgi:hypothetical protein
MAAHGSTVKQAIAAWGASMSVPVAEPRSSDTMYRLLVQGVTDYAIYMLDPTRRVSNWNAGRDAPRATGPRRSWAATSLAQATRR